MSSDSAVPVEGAYASEYLQKYASETFYSKFDVCLLLTSPLY